MSGIFFKNTGHTQYVFKKSQAFSEKSLVFSEKDRFSTKRWEARGKKCHGKCIVNTVEERNTGKEGIRSKSLHSTVPTKWMKKRKI
jgi:hypothetical protein